VSVTVTNVGSHTAPDVAQLYVGIPDASALPKQLRGFKKVMLAPGQGAQLLFPLTHRDLLVYDVSA